MNTTAISGTVRIQQSSIKDPGEARHPQIRSHLGPFRFLPLMIYITTSVCAFAQTASPPPEARPSVVIAMPPADQGSVVMHDPRTPIDAAHSYTLGELIQLAEEHNPDSRAAWQQARAQAAALGIARAELFPALAAVLMVNTTRDGVLLDEGFVRQTLGLYQPVLEVNYLLFDFGGRAARIQEARARLLASRFNANRVVLDVLFETERRYYSLLNSVGQRNAAEINFRNADTVRAAVDARLANGLATLPDALEARAAAKQANFALQAAVGQVDIDRASLLSLLGASPLVQLAVQPLDELKLPNAMEADPHASMETALRQRPELSAGVADLREAQAEERASRSAFLPSLSFSGTGGEIRAYGQQNQLPRMYAGPLEVWNVNLNLRWELFEGGRRLSEAARSRANERRAQAGIDRTRDEVELQVWTAYVQLRTAFADRDAAAALLSAARTSYDASLRSYQLGLRNTVDVVTAQRTLAQALSSDIAARTDLLLQLANLAYRTGDLLSVAAKKDHP